VDTTEAKRLREELEDTERLRSLGELAGGVAHDFNNLLSAILGRAQLLRQRGFDPATDDDLAVIEQAALDGRETVLRIQEFSRTRSDRPMSPVNLKEILQGAIEITRLRWKTETEKRNVAIRVIRELHDVPPILGNASELREVFVNLILNSIHALPDGGELRLSCGEAHGQVHAEVEDDGEGMSEEVRRRLFDPFFSTKGMGGTGLGMSVAYGIVQRHRGNIKVSSGPGRGTRVVLDFPRATGSSVHAEKSDAEPLVPGPARARILVVDDEPPIAQLLRDALSTQGHEVETALCGRDGVRMATSGAFDLVLTDLGMPDMSGWEVVRGIRPTHPDLPVVLVTGWGATISEAEIADAGVAALVHKPFEMKPLLDTISRLLAAEEAVDAPLRQG
jgi:CheY-like chemotaxis protein